MGIQVCIGCRKIKKIKSMNNDILLRILKRMITVRETEEFISKKVENKEINCPCHLAVGQEATPSVLVEFLKQQDRIYGTHRSHNQYLAATDDVEGLLAETLGKKTGCAKGMGGSQHLICVEKNFGGSVPIVGGTIPIACGAALSMKLQNNNGIAIPFFGDGSTEEGVFHESLNLASIMQLPVCFIAENNLFASHLHILERQPEISLCRFAKAHSIKNIQLDGNDVISLYDNLKQIIDYVRNERCPYFVEVMTYRWKGHVGYREDLDVGVKRKEDLTIWKTEKDPIKRLLCVNEDLKNIYSKLVCEIQQRIENAWDFAKKSDYADKDFLLRCVYCED